MMSALLPTAAFAADTTYIVEFDAPGLAQTGRAPNRRSPEFGRFHQDLDRIHDEQNARLARIESRIGRRVTPRHRYRYVLNGVALVLASDEAEAVGAMDGVRRVSADSVLHLLQVEGAPADAVVAAAGAASVAASRGERLPDPVVATVGALGVWDGSGTGLPPTRGEGIVVGVIGAGINGGHPSFAATGDDGFTHANPYGDGVYLGLCESQPQLCNAKLVGRYNFTSSDDPEDPEGSGSYAASVAAGNVLFDVELPNNVGSLSGALVPVISGVAPHANVVMYDVCVNLCQTTAVISALEQAGLDGIDVLIMTVGTGSGSSFGDPVSLAFLSLRAQGVSSVFGASVNGPDDGSITRAAVAPWTTTFTRTTHSRVVGAKRLDNFTGGMTPPPVLFGAGLSPGLSAPIMDAAGAGDFDPDDIDVRQCNVPFPPATFAGSIAVCERGPIPFTSRVQNVTAGGASGMIVINPTDPLGLPQPVIPVVSPFPYIALSAPDGATLREWLSVGSDHSATIGVAQYVDVPQFGDQLDVYNARGPSLGEDFLAPSAAAPGIAVLAAWGPPRDFRFLNGRGSYPGAGAIALLKSLHPQWSEAQILSALVTTGHREIIDQATLANATPFGIGGGRINVAAAARSTLVLDVAYADFTALIPSGDGLRDLNLPGLVDLECLVACSFTRTVRATRDGSWTAAGISDSAGLQVTVSPTAFTLADGDEQQITVTVSGDQAGGGGFQFGAVALAPTDDDAAPVTTLPVAIDLLVDPDGDGVASRLDNCTRLPNVDQRDTNGDGFGNRCDGDLNNDGIVNAADLGLMRAAFDVADADADLDGDGLVNEQDLTILRELYFAPPGPSAVAASRR
jgi:hypothetical protein